MSDGQIIALGSINLDIQVRTERWPDAGETLEGRDFLMSGGGKAANVAFLAHRLGLRAVLLGHVGEDALADLALRPLQDAGVNLDHVRKVQGKDTAVSLITVRPGGDKAIVLAGNANDAWDDHDAQQAAEAVTGAPDGSVLVADLEVPVDVVRRAVEAAKQRGFRVVLDPSPAERMPEELYRSADYITPNPPEAKRLTGSDVRSPDDAFRAGEKLVERGVGVALMKLADGGCCVVSRELHERVQAPRVKVVDKTGAGDAFAGSLGVAVLEGRQPLDAARFAVTTAALAVTRYGSQPSYPTREEIERLLRQQS